MPPLIGISTNRELAKSGIYIHELSEAYTAAVIRAGGLPFLIPSDLPAEQAPEVLQRVDGLMLTGGGDIDPQLFNGDPHHKVYAVDLKRDSIELELVRLAAQSGMPFLGICRGIQVINVALGGTLFTHIADQLPGAIEHDWHSATYGRDYLAHEVSIQPGSLLNRITGSTQLATNSLHHQGIARLAQDLLATAHTSDGLVEAVELRNHAFGLGVQWHPECLPNLDPHQALFRALVRAAKNSELH